MFQHSHFIFLPSKKKKKNAFYFVVTLLRKFCSRHQYKAKFSMLSPRGYKQAFSDIGILTQYLSRQVLTFNSQQHCFVNYHPFNSSKHSATLTFFFFLVHCKSFMCLHLILFNIPSLALDTCVLSFFRLRKNYAISCRCSLACPRKEWSARWISRHSTVLPPLCLFCVCILNIVLQKTIREKEDQERLSRVQN